MVQHIKKVHTFVVGFKKANNFFNLKRRKKMKKLVFMFAAIVAVSFASCGGNTNNAEAVDSCAADSCCGDSACVETVDSCCGDTACADTVVAE